jgi:hypothetical protein
MEAPLSHASLGGCLDSGCQQPTASHAAPAGSRLHAVADEGVPFREIADAIGRNLTLPAVSIPPEEAADYFDFHTNAPHRVKPEKKGPKPWT